MPSLSFRDRKPEVRLFWQWIKMKEFWTESDPCRLCPQNLPSQIWAMTSAAPLSSSNDGVKADQGPADASTVWAQSADAQLLSNARQMPKPLSLLFSWELL